MDINLIIKGNYNKAVVEKILKNGVKQNFFYSKLLYGMVYPKKTFRPINLLKATKDLIEGNIDEINALYVKVEDTFFSLLILQNNANEDEILISIEPFFFFFKQFINTFPEDGVETDFPRYSRTLLRWLKDFDLVNFILQKDFIERPTSKYTTDYTRSIEVDINLSYPNFDSNLEIFFNNSLIHGYKFTDQSNNILKLDQIHKTIEKDLSIPIYFYARDYPIKFDLSEFAISLQPLEPYAIQKKYPKLLLDWSFYIEILLQLTEGFWINDCRIIQPDEYV